MPKRKDPRKENTVPRQRKFVYKRATFAIEPNADSLEKLVRDAWASVSHESGKRRQITETESGACFVTHYRTEVHGMTFLEIIFFTPGMKALAANIDFTKPSIDVEEHDVKTEAGVKLELIQNITYVGISQNHVVLLPSGELRSPEIEAHLNWLLTKATPTLKDGQEIRLSNRIPPNKEEEVRNARQIHFSTDVVMAATDTPSGEKKLVPHGTSWAGLRSLLTGLGKEMADVATDLDVSGLTEATPVNVDITLKWAKSGKKKNHEVMDKIATGLRHLDTELNFEIITPNGKIKKSELLLERSKSIRCKGERPVRDLLWETIHQWLVDLQSSGDIA